ncbi:apoptotic chromatin condensation inducer in the nucleus [Diplogelasinospora grovesii]|uniref:Apoptotic chromatin condensation inducer in the nucleus n=1 Tax=Diplogelasinospora grovesii TaxID=303347 RepID=A0AAN6NFD3_9PEZI|nr:apoptotic chromatin condensation inducer in the nucleus [Diplogelasinospora grovesii]
MTMTTEWKRLTVADLRVELRKRKLPATGLKAELVERLTRWDVENAAAQDDAANASEETETQTDDTVTEIQPAPESTSQSDISAHAPQPSEEPATAKKVTISDNAPSVSVESPAVSEAPKSVSDVPAPAMDNSDSTQESAQDEKTEEAPPAEPTPTPAPSELSKDARSRKRRSRSPPPSEHDVSRKRARQSDQNEEDDDQQMVLEPSEATVPSEEEPPNRNEQIVEDVSYAKVALTVPAPQPPSPSSSHAVPQNEDESAAGLTSAEDSTTTQKEEEASDAYADKMNRESRDSPEAEAGDIQQRDYARGDAMDDDSKYVPPAEHPATSALYIKNFMRPLREPQLRDHLTILAASPGSDPDPGVIVDFYLDQIRTHAFVQFTSVAAASRVRISLHGETWPNERNRKELWVDFMPPESVREWAEREKSEGGRGSTNRWEVIYDLDHRGVVRARLVNAANEPLPITKTRQQPPNNTPFAPPPIPTGPSARSGVEGAPLGPRGRGGGGAAAGGVYKSTAARPSLRYKPVPEDLAQRRIDNMRSYYTQDKKRDLGREDEINRYTFEDQEQFVDRGKEFFVGIRPPHREAERRRLGLGRGDRGPPRGPRAAGGGGGGRGRGGSDRRDEMLAPPRSRFDGGPLPTFNKGRDRSGW